MVFSSALFIFGFAPIFFFCYFSVPERGRNPVILVASILFYAMGAGTVALVLMGSVWLNQFVARRLVVSDRKNSARLLAMGVGLNLAALIYYKYTAFGWNIVANMFQGLAGVSFGSAPRIGCPSGFHSSPSRASLTSLMFTAVGCCPHLGTSTSPFTIRSSHNS